MNLGSKNPMFDWQDDGLSPRDVVLLRALYVSAITLFTLAVAVLYLLFR